MTYSSSGSVTSMYVIRESGRYVTTKHARHSPRCHSHGCLPVLELIRIANAREANVAGWEPEAVDAGSD